MNIDIARLCETLHADYELHPLLDGEGHWHIFRFRDDLLRYELHVHEIPGTITLAADPDEPIQACPLLEYSFSCLEVEIGANAYFENAGDAIRFWQHRINQSGIRLTLTPREDGRWYAWANAWDPAPG